MLAIDNISNLVISKDKIIDLLNIYEVKGNHFYYVNLFKKNEKSFYKKRDYENIFYLAKILKIDFTPSKLDRFSKSDYLAKNNDEIYFLNIKEALGRISKNKDNFEIVANELIDLASLIYKNIKRNPLNNITADKLEYLANKDQSERNFIEFYVSKFLKIYQKRENELLMILLSFLLDIDCLLMFKENNFLVALISFYGLLQKDFKVFNYVSFFKHLYENLDEFNKIMQISRTNWQLKSPEIISLLKVLIKIIKQADSELKLLGQSYQFEITRNKSDAIENFILRSEQIFSKDEIRKALPRLSEATINRALKRLRDEGKIIPLKTGRSASWQRVVKGIKEDMNFGIFTKAEFDKKSK